MRGPRPRTHHQAQSTQRHVDSKHRSPPRPKEIWTPKRCPRGLPLTEEHRAAGRICQGPFSPMPRRRATTTRKSLSGDTPVWRPGRCAGRRGAKRRTPAPSPETARGGCSPSEAATRPEMSPEAHPERPFPPDALDPQECGSPKVWLDRVRREIHADRTGTRCLCCCSYESERGRDQFGFAPDFFSPPCSAIAELPQRCCPS